MLGGSGIDAGLEVLWFNKKALCQSRNIRCDFSSGSVKWLLYVTAPEDTRRHEEKRSLCNVHILADTMTCPGFLGLDEISAGAGLI